MNCSKCKSSIFFFNKKKDYHIKLRGIDITIPNTKFWECTKCKEALITPRLAKEITNQVIRIESEQNNRYPHSDVPDYLPTKEEVCCEDMFRYMRQNSDCENHGYNCPDRGIDYQNKKTIEGVAIEEGYLLRAPNASYSMNFCPWCGKSLTKPETPA